MRSRTYNHVTKMADGGDAYFFQVVGGQFHQSFTVYVMLGEQMSVLLEIGEMAFLAKGGQPLILKSNTDCQSAAGIPEDSAVVRTFPLPHTIGHN